jgi:type II restriction/modification system DNA methylase subunit YeeA
MVRTKRDTDNKTYDLLLEFYIYQKSRDELEDARNELSKVQIECFMNLIRFLKGLLVFFAALILLFAGITGFEKLIPYFS